MTCAFQEDRSVVTRTARAADRTLRYGPHADHVADLWYGDARHPLVVMIHGGFWRPEYDRTHTAPLCAAVADAGWSIVTIEYRRIPGQPDLMVEDVGAALAAVPTAAAHHDGRVIGG